MAHSSRNDESLPSPLALGSLALSMLLASSGTSIPNVSLPTLARAFSASVREVQWVVIAYLLAMTILMVGAGRLGDAIGRRKALLIGASLFALSALLCGIAPSLGFLVASRLLQGAGAAVLMALSVATVSEIVPKVKLGRSMGLLGTMSALGTALGPSLGGLLIGWGSWRWIFLAMVPFGLVTALLLHRYLPDPDANRELRSVVETRSPLFPWDALRNANILANLTMNALVSSVMMSTLVVGPFYLSHGLGLTMTTVGLVMSAGPITSVLAGFPAGRIVDRLGAPMVMVLGLLELGVGALAMSRLPPLLGTTGYLIAAILMSPGYQMFQAANNAGVMEKVRSDQRGVVSGMLGLSRNLGLISGTAVMGAVFSFSLRSAQIETAPADSIANGLRVTFSAAAAFAFLALFIAVGLARRGRG